MYASNWLIQKNQGADGIYIFAILLQIISVCNIVTLCCSKSIRNLGGIFWGEGEYWSFRALFHLTLKLCIIVSLIIFLVVFIFPEYSLSLFGASNELMNTQVENLRKVVSIVIPQAIIILFSVLYYIQGYHKLCVFLNIISAIGSCIIIALICLFYPKQFWSLFPVGSWLLLFILLSCSSVVRKKKRELEKFTLIPLISEKPSATISINYSHESVSAALNTLNSFVDIIETDNDMMVKIAIEELLYNTLDHNLTSKKNSFFDVRVVDNDDYLAISVKNCGIPDNPIVQYSDKDVMYLDKSNIRLAVLGRICKSISYEYMNGINCTFLKFDINRKTSVKK